LLLDDEFEEFFSDRTGWTLRKAFPRLSSLTESLGSFYVDAASYNVSIRMLAAQLSTPAGKEMIKDLWAIEEFYGEFAAKAAVIEKEVEEMGYPNVTGGMASVPFDDYSDFLRGSIESMNDLYERPGEIEKYIEAKLEVTLDMIKSMKGINDGKQIFMPLHKGMDSFMNDEHYRKFYWKHLQKIIVAIIDSGKVPFIYTEGKYNSRLDCLTEVPPGKVFYHFEEVDMAVAKKKLGGIACIAGGFRSTLLDWGTPDEVREEVKRHMDACAPGGGYIFETSCGIGNAKRENVEAMFEAAREFGKY
jgi:uroporphyrinogen-III decarboxylase